MRQTTEDIVAGVKGLIDDPDGDFADTEKIIPLLQIAQEEILNELLSNSSLGRYKTSVVVPNVPIGTTSLADFFKEGGVLELLSDVISMKEKVTAADDVTYQPMDLMRELPVQKQTGYNGSARFTGDDIELPGATQALDIKVYGVFEPQPIKDKDSPVLPGCALPLKYWTAALLLDPRNANLAATRRADAQRTLDTLFTRMMREMQGEDTRSRAFGEQNGGGSVNY